MPLLVRDKELGFVLQCTYAERSLPRDAYFLWHKERKVWYTPKISVAASLRRFASKECQEYLTQKMHWAGPPLIPPDLKLYPHQSEAVAFAMTRKASYLALEPGLGKTICAAVIAENGRYDVYYVCPPFLVENVKAEFAKWAPTTPLRVIADTMLEKVSWAEMLAPARQGRPILFVDEAHRFKTPKSRRTKSLFGKVSLFNKVVYLSGTPMPNGRPMELYPILSKSAPECIDHMNKFQFGRKYCAGYKGRFGWDFSGASNLPEFAERIKPFMLTMRKADVLDLPPKIEEAFIITGDMRSHLARLDRDLGAAYKDVDDLIKQKLAGAGNIHLMTYRKLLGQEKVRHAVAYIRSILDDTNENILVFAYHKEVMAELESQLAEYLPYVIRGGISNKKRHAEVKEFQTSQWRLVLANYSTMVGFTLTKAARVLFTEFSWVPGDNQQAIDRLHRIGQTADSVLVQYMIYKNSLDKRILERVLEKSRNISKL